MLNLDFWPETKLQTGEEHPVVLPLDLQREVEDIRKAGGHVVMFYAGSPRMDGEDGVERERRDYLDAYPEMERFFQ